MGFETEIGWTHHTFNMWRSCVEVAPECANCYARELAKQNPKILGKWGKDGTRVVAAAKYWQQPLKWNAMAREAGERRRVFCASLADVFEDWQGPMVDVQGNRLHIAEGGAICGEWRAVRPATMQDIRDKLFALIDKTPYLDWLLLTKRPENIVRMVPTRHHNGDRAYANIWLGTSAGTQATANAKIPELLNARHLAPVLFVSAEPLLEPVDFLYPSSLFPNGPRYCCDGRECGCQGLPVDPWPWVYPRGEGIDWIIVGGESGHKRRDCGVRAIVDIANQCKSAGVPCYVKQDCAREDGQQGRIPDHTWNIKEYPNHATN